MQATIFHNLAHLLQPGVVFSYGYRLEQMSIFELLIQLFLEYTPINLTSFLHLS